MSDAAITQASKRVRVAAERDGNLRKILDKMVKRLGMYLVET
jgi:hypothetical protein